MDEEDGKAAAGREPMRDLKEAGVQTRHLSRLKADLEGWTYQPSPVRRVEIPKPGGRGIRLESIMHQAKGPWRMGG